MRRIKRPPIEVFNLSFLDIISCAFGAVVMLVLLAKNGEQDSERGPADVSVMINEVLQAQAAVETLSGQVSAKQAELAAAQARSAAVTEQQQNLQTSIPRAQQTLAQLQDKAKSLREQIRQANARLNAATPSAKPDDEVGGIPTDADYVVFVIDNSGSMSSGFSWNRVTDVVKDIIRSHPQMKGFQIMAADGSHLYPGQEGKWLSDSQSMRDRAISRLAGFRGGASAPEVGINEALDLYGNTQGTVSLYVFGDDYRPADLDQVVSQITQKNRRADGKARVRIHGIGFNRPKNGNAQQFAAFMQAVAKRNRGAFVGLYF